MVSIFGIEWVSLSVIERVFLLLNELSIDVYFGLGYNHDIPDNNDNHDNFSLLQS